MMVICCPSATPNADDCQMMEGHRREKAALPCFPSLDSSYQDASHFCQHLSHLDFGNGGKYLKQWEESMNLSSYTDAQLCIKSQTVITLSYSF